MKFYYQDEEKHKEVSFEVPTKRITPHIRAQYMIMKREYSAALKSAMTKRPKLAEYADKGIAEYPPDIYELNLEATQELEMLELQFDIETAKLILDETRVPERFRSEWDGAWDSEFWQNAPDYDEMKAPLESFRSKKRGGESAN